MSYYIPYCSTVEVQRPSHIIEARALDPLGLDPLIAILPLANEWGDVDRIKEPLSFIGAAARSGWLASLSTAETWAALRDTDVLASSMQHHGRDPVVEVGGLEQAFVGMSESLGLRVSRAPIAAYIGAHPTEEGRRRLFTVFTKDETAFVANLQTSYDSLDRTVARLSTADFAFHSAKQLALRLAAARTAYGVMHQSVLNVEDQVDNTIFTKRIQPFFPRLTIRGEEFYAAGGSHLPAAVLDEFIRGDRGTPDGRHQEYVATVTPYLTPRQAAMLVAFKKRNGESFTSFILREDSPLSEADRLLLEERLTRTLAMSTRMRGRHLRLVKDSFELREEASTGSGGGDYASTRRIAEANRDAYHEVRPARQA